MLKVNQWSMIWKITIWYTDLISYVHIFVTAGGWCGRRISTANFKVIQLSVSEILHMSCPGYRDFSWTIWLTYLAPSTTETKSLPKCIHKLVHEPRFINDALGAGGDYLWPVWCKWNLTFILLLFIMGRDDKIIRIVKIAGLHRKSSGWEAIET